MVQLGGPGGEYDRCLACGLGAARPGAPGLIRCLGVGDGSGDISPVLLPVTFADWIDRKA